MIKSIEAKFFRKHEDLKINFTKGLNVLRGSNEAGKTTVTEIILYALYGAASLVDKLEEVVTWGHKESELRAKLIISISEIEYIFVRSKSGAEVNYAGVDGKPVKVTGQKEVTAFAAQLLGADAKTASVLMLSSQAGLRGALDEGPAAVGALMGKLADFDTIDKLLDTAAKTLALGSIVPIQAKLAEADLEVLDATAALTDPALIAALDIQIEGLAGTHAASSVTGEDLCEAVARADAAHNAAVSNNNSFDAAQRAVSDARAALAATKTKLADAQKAAANRPAADAVEAARKALVDAKNHAAVVEAYSAFKAIPAYPEVAWDEPQASFETELAAHIARRDDLKLKHTLLGGEVKPLQGQIISGDGKCPTCGHVGDKREHTLARNAEIATAIGELTRQQAVLAEQASEEQETITTLEGLRASAVARQKFIDRCAVAYVSIDTSVYPSKVTWANGVPEAAADVPARQHAVDTFAQQERACVLAEGQVAVYVEAVVTQEEALATAIAVAGRLELMPTQPLQDAYDAAYRAYAEQNDKTRALGLQLEELRGQKAEMARVASGAAQRLATAQARVKEYVADIATMEFNNELVRKLKSMKPIITDHLWSNVLAAVGNFFSVLRGEQSIVTKDSTGFKVNGRGGSLSGSTLDMLALAIRVALSKTFVPHANFMVLDEPAHGCDNVRASALLGFLSGVGFEQTILASHDELSESVADNVIVLGA